MRRRSFSRRTGPQKRLTWIGLSSVETALISGTINVLYILDDVTRASFGLGDVTFMGAWFNISMMGVAPSQATFGQNVVAMSLVEATLDSSSDIAAGVLTELNPLGTTWFENKSVLWHWHGLVAQATGVPAFPTHMQTKVPVKRRLPRGEGLALLVTTNNTTANEVFMTYSLRGLFKEV